jgi:hypothetical protein
MARDRDHAEVAARTRAQAEALLAAWHGYTQAEAKLESIVQCPASWEGEAQCDLLAGHQGLHRGRLLGTQVVAQW